MNHHINFSFKVENDILCKQIARLQRKYIHILLTTLLLFFPLYISKNTILNVKSSSILNKQMIWVDRTDSGQDIYDYDSSSDTIEYINYYIPVYPKNKYHRSGVVYTIQIHKTGLINIGNYKQF